MSLLTDKTQKHGQLFLSGIGTGDFSVWLNLYAATTGIGFAFTLTGIIFSVPVELTKVI
jgi:hypothetical protein